ncbi:uncharacterized protein ATC70_012228 [Mucor velutinosus]|uniref:Uncharacterized protein n=1 Tax=Mucor velutinosus TaxID=708070 RepID=A0AAN7D576_9FUNG|nr:hypothetical protein ATC70_012228 [Mucor velutinosus]
MNAISGAQAKIKEATYCLSPTEIDQKSTAAAATPAPSKNRRMNNNRDQIKTKEATTRHDEPKKQTAEVAEK